MALGNNVTWLQDGEKANALVLNRPLKEALTEIDAKIIELENKLQNGGTGSGGTGSGGTGSGSNNSAEIQAIQTEIQNLKNTQTQLQNKQNELEGKVNQLQQNQGSGGSGSGGSGNQGGGSTQTPTLPNLQQNEVELRAGTKDYNITYTANRALFYCEGILLRPSEYTATNGTSITLKFEPKTGETLTAVSL